MMDMDQVRDQRGSPILVMWYGILRQFYLHRQ